MTAHSFAGRAWPWAALALVVAAHVNRAWAAVAPFDAYAFDGPFQVYDALRRLDAGQAPGRDFPAFHGAGLPLAHYPVYRVLGGDLFAAELARQLVSRLGTVAGYLLAAWLMTRDVRPGVFWALLTVTPGGHLLPVRLPLESVADPGNSLSGLRSLTPVLFVALLDRAGPAWGWSAVLGAVLATAWLLGMEQGTALAAAVAVTAAAVRLARRGRPAVPGGPRLGRALIAAGAVLAVVLPLVCTPAGVAELLRFYFVDLPADQVWYFGAPPNPFLGDGTAASRRQAVAVAALAVALAGWWAWEVRAARGAADAAALRPRLAAAVGAGYGLLSLAAFLGILGADYATGALRMAVVLLTVRAWPHVAVGAGRTAVVSLVVVLAVAAGWAAAQHWSLDRPRGLSGRWQQLADDFPAAVRAVVPEPATGDLWSTYAGLVEARLGVFHPREDYVIHALGPRRAAYVAAFAADRPPFVQTNRRGAMLGFEEWLWATTWPFYERVLLNYDVTAVSAQTLLWRRRPGPWHDPPGDDPAAWTPVPVAGDEAIIPAGPDGGPLELAVVRVEYEVANPLAAVPLVGQTPRYLATPVGGRVALPVSLPPRATSHTFPVVPEPGRPVTLRFSVAGPLPGAGLRVTGVAVRYLTVRPENRLFLEG